MIKYDAFRYDDAGKYLVLATLVWDVEVAMAPEGNTLTSMRINSEDFTRVIKAEHMGRQYGRDERLLFAVIDWAFNKKMSGFDLLFNTFFQGLVQDKVQWSTGDAQRRILDYVFKSALDFGIIPTEDDGNIIYYKKKQINESGEEQEQ